MSGITDSDRTCTGGALNAKISSLEKWAADRFLPFFTNKFISDPTDSQYSKGPYRRPPPVYYFSSFLPSPPKLIGTPPFVRSSPLSPGNYEFFL